MKSDHTVRTPVVSDPFALLLVAQSQITQSALLLCQISRHIYRVTLVCAIEESDNAVCTADVSDRFVHPAPCATKSCSRTSVETSQSAFSLHQV